MTDQSFSVDSVLVDNKAGPVPQYFGEGVSYALQRDSLEVSNTKGKTLAIQILDFSQSSDFDFNSSLVNFTGTQAELLKGPDAQTFVQDYSNSIGFTFDSALAEFVSGLVRQKNLSPADSTLGVNYSSSLNANWVSTGSGTAIASGGPTLSGGKMVCSGNQGVYYVRDMHAKGAIKFRFTPNYSGAPPANRNLVSTQIGTTTNDRMFIFNGSTGTIRMNLQDSSGVTILSAATIGLWAPVSGQEYEFEFNYDSVAGVLRVFIDGVLLGTASPGPWARSGNAGRLYVGSFFDGTYATTEGEFDDVIDFSEVQHAAGYTPGYVVEDFLFMESTVVLPSFVYTSLDDIVGYTSLTTVETGAPKYTVNGRYWNGALWASSNFTYAQASTQADISANLPSYPVLSDTIDICLVFQGSNTLNSADNLIFGYNGVAYPSDALITSNIINSMDELLTFLEEVITPTNTEVKYILTVQGQDTWYDSGWVNSDGSSAESNTRADISANIATLDLTGGKNVFVKIYLISTDNLSTPSITALAYKFSLSVTTITEPTITAVFGVIRKLDGSIAADAQVEIEYVANELDPYAAEGTIIRPSKVILTANSEGEIVTDLVTSALYARKYKFTIRYTLLGELSATDHVWGFAEIPNEVSVNINTLTFTSTV